MHSIEKMKGTSFKTTADKKWATRAYGEFHQIGYNSGTTECYQLKLAVDKQAKLDICETVKRFAPGPCWMGMLKLHKVSASGFGKGMKVYRTDQPGVVCDGNVATMAIKIADMLTLARADGAYNLTINNNRKEVMIEAKHGNYLIREDEQKMLRGHYEAKVSQMAEAKSVFNISEPTLLFGEESLDEYVNSKQSAMDAFISISQANQNMLWMKQGIECLTAKTKENAIDAKLMNVWLAKLRELAADLKPGLNGKENGWKAMVEELTVSENLNVCVAQMLNVAWERYESCGSEVMETALTMLIQALEATEVIIPMYERSVGSVEMLQDMDSIVYFSEGKRIEYIVLDGGAEIDKLVFTKQRSVYTATDKYIETKFKMDMSYEKAHAHRAENKMIAKPMRVVPKMNGSANQWWLTIALQNGDNTKEGMCRMACAAHMELWGRRTVEEAIKKFPTRGDVKATVLIENMIVQTECMAHDGIEPRVRLLTIFNMYKMLLSARLKIAIRENMLKMDTNSEDYEMMGRERDMLEEAISENERHGASLSIQQPQIFEGQLHVFLSEWDNMD